MSNASQRTASAKVPGLLRRRPRTHMWLPPQGRLADSKCMSEVGPRQVYKSTAVGRVTPSAVSDALAGSNAAKTGTGPEKARRQHYVYKHGQKASGPGHYVHVYSMLKCIGRPHSRQGWTARSQPPGGRVIVRRQPG
jgi:hypothetical protein